LKLSFGVNGLRDLVNLVSRAFWTRGSLAATGAKIVQLFINKCKTLDFVD
jgi:hypothetical protein